MSGTGRASAACLLAAFAACASLALAGPSWAWHYRATTIASGLDNPRDLAVGPDGNLYVAEAGHAGTECGTTGGEKTCLGFTSGISRVTWSGGVHRVVSGLLSIGEESGFGAVGVDALSFFGGHAYVLEAESAAKLPTGPGISAATLARARAEAGRLGAFDYQAHGRVVADVGGFDYQWAKEHESLVPGQFPDANPYGVLATQWGEFVVDAGSNTLDFVSPSGGVQVLAFFPNPPSSDAVPTCIDRGPDGALYISQLTGGGNKPGTANVYRWTPGHPLSVWASGLTAVTGCGFGPDGQFYAVEFSTLGLDGAAPGTGAIVRVPPHSTSPETAVAGLSFPGGFAAGREAIYTSNWSIAPANSGGGPTGQVIRVTAG